jgi:methylmalonyl-CoA mutase C-terminal domain/subunit
VDAIGLSIMSGAHMTLFPTTIESLKSEGLGDTLVFGGGIIPEADMNALHELGVGHLFAPGSPMQSIVTYIQDWVREKRPF